MEIRNLRHFEVDALCEIVRKNYSNEYAEKAKWEFLDMFGNSQIKPTYLVAEELGEIRGFGGFQQSMMDYNIYEIFWINVDPKHRRRKIGTKIVKKIIDEIRKEKESKLIQLTTTSQEFYNQFGFETLRTFNQGKNFLMILDLDKS